MITIDMLAAKFHAHRSGSGWIAHCPGPMHEHGDRSCSLSFREGSEGRIVMHCFAGCDTGDVLQAAGLSWRDVLPASAPISQTEVERQRDIAERCDRAAFEILDRIRRFRDYYRNCLFRVEILQQRIGDQILNATSLTELEQGWEKLARLAPVATLYHAGFNAAFTGFRENSTLLTRFALASPRERRTLMLGD